MLPSFWGFSNSVSPEGVSYYSSSSVSNLEDILDFFLLEITFNPSESLWGSPFKMYRAYEHFYHDHCCCFGPATTLSQLDYYTHFLTGPAGCPLPLTGLAMAVHLKLKSDHVIISTQKPSQASHLPQNESPSPHYGP